MKMVSETERNRVRVLTAPCNGRKSKSKPRKPCVTKRMSLGHLRSTHPFLLFAFYGLGMNIFTTQLPEDVGNVRQSTEQYQDTFTGLLELLTHMSTCGLQQTCMAQGRGSQPLVAAQELPEAAKASCL